MAIYGGTSNDQLPQMQEVILQSLETLRLEGATSEEVSDSKEQLKGNLMLGLESTSARMSRNGKQALLLGRHQDAEEVLKLIEAVTIDKVQEKMQLMAGQPAVSIIRSKEASAV